MTTPRDELEAAIWRAATYVSDEGTAGYLLSVAAVDAILEAADAYAAGDSDQLAAFRRQVLFRDAAPQPRKVTP